MPKARRTAKKKSAKKTPKGASGSARISRTRTALRKPRTKPRSTGKKGATGSKLKQPRSSKSSLPKKAARQGAPALAAGHPGVLHFNFLQLLREEVLPDLSPAVLDQLLQLPRHSFVAWERLRWPAACEAGSRLVQLRPRILIAALGARELVCLPKVTAHAKEQLDRIHAGGGLIDDPGAAEANRRRLAERIPVIRELATKAYGRILWTVDETGQVEAFRITQAAEGVSTKDCRVLSRLSPLGRRLVTAAVGDDREDLAGRLLTVIGNAYVRRYEDAFGEHARDFQTMELQLEELSAPLRVHALATAVAAERTGIADSLHVATLVAPPEEPLEPEVGAQRLRSEFYIRTTLEQEQIVTRIDSGLVVVLGVAGSGKTSVALGRTKALCDLSTSDAELHYAPESARGFVLSRQLSSYLQEAIEELSLGRMVLEDFGEHRRAWRLRRDLLGIGARGRSGEPPYALSDEDLVATAAPEGRMAWLRAVDEVLALIIGSRLGEAFGPATGTNPGPPRPEGLSGSQSQSLEAIWSVAAASARQLASALTAESSRPFQLWGLGARLDELKADVAARLGAAEAWRDRASAAKRESVMRTLTARLERLVRFSNLYATALADPRFAEALARRQALEPAALEKASQRVTSRHTLSDPDLDVVIALELIAGAETRKGSQGALVPKPDYATQVFIDEFQDFSEVQLFVMGAQAEPSRGTITLVGDYAQQLTPGARVELAACFPRTRPEEIRQEMLWSNMRQSGHLATLSQRYREVALGSGRPPKAVVAPARKWPRLVRLDNRLDWESALLVEVARVPPHALTAIVFRDLGAARDAHARLERSLRVRGYESAVSRHGELAAAGILHFTTPLECKGLDFDAVLIPALDAWAFERPEEAHAAYVALSRPREYLSVVHVGPLSPVLELLTREGLFEVVAT